MNLKMFLQNASHEVSNLSTEVKELSRIHSELLKIEASECIQHIKKKVIVAGLLCSIFFFLFCIVLVSGISALGVYIKPLLSEPYQPYSWQIVAASISLIFILAIICCVFFLLRKPKESFFSHTKQEFQNNREWLQNLSKQENNNSSQT